MHLVTVLQDQVTSLITTISDLERNSAEFANNIAELWGRVFRIMTAARPAHGTMGAGESCQNMLQTDTLGQLSNVRLNTRPQRTHGDNFCTAVDGHGARTLPSRVACSLR